MAIPLVSPLVQNLLGAARKITFVVGVGGDDKSFQLKHSLGTTDLIVTVYDANTLRFYGPNTIGYSYWVVDTNNIMIEFPGTPANGQYRVMILG